LWLKKQHYSKFKLLTNKMKTIYKKTQYGILTYFLLFVMLLLTIAYWYQLGNNPIPLIPYLGIMVFFTLLILLFYKLTIQIDEEKITAIFGIGLLKKSMLLNEIDTIENFKIPWYAGIGIRLTTKGWLWNVSTGNAILIQNKTRSKTFLVGSKDVDTIIKILKK